MKGLSGEASCGCFGTVTVNPWYTALFDLVIVACLIVFRPEKSNTKSAAKSGWTQALRLEHKKILAVLTVWLMLAVPTLFAMLSLKQQPHATLGTEFIGADGTVTIMLEPHMWVDKAFPLWNHVDDESRLTLEKGEWNIVIGRKQCEECKQLIKKLGTREMTPVAILELNDGLTDMGVSEYRTMVSVTGTLTIDPHWVILTPALVKCRNGICISVGENFPHD